MKSNVLNKKSKSYHKRCKIIIFCMSRYYTLEVSKYLSSNSVICVLIYSPPSLLFLLFSSLLFSSRHIYPDGRFCHPPHHSPLCRLVVSPLMAAPPPDSHSPRSFFHNFLAVVLSLCLIHLTFF
jgi:hypothetical protein